VPLEQPNTGVLAVRSTAWLGDMDRSDPLRVDDALFIDCFLINTVHITLIARSIGHYRKSNQTAQGWDLRSSSQPVDHDGLDA
jgi:hypothetical protein